MSPLNTPQHGDELTWHKVQKIRVVLLQFTQTLSRDKTPKSQHCTPSSCSPTFCQMTTYQQKAVFTERDLPPYYGQPFICIPRVRDSILVCLIMLLYFIAEPYFFFLLLHALTVLNMGEKKKIYIFHF